MKKSGGRKQHRRRRPYGPPAYPKLAKPKPNTDRADEMAIKLTAANLETGPNTRANPSRETRTRAAPGTTTAWSWVLGKALHPDSVFSLLPSRTGARQARGQQIALTYIMPHYHSAIIALQSQHAHTGPPAKRHRHHVRSRPPAAAFSCAHERRPRDAGGDRHVDAADRPHCQA